MSRTNVKILVGKKLLEMIKENCLKSEKDFVREMVNEENIIEKEGKFFLSYTNVKWNERFEDVNAVTSMLKKANEMVERDSELLDDYYYKLVSLPSAECFDEYSNDDDEVFTESFYGFSDFSM